MKSKLDARFKRFVKSTDTIAGEDQNSYERLDCFSGSETSRTCIHRHSTRGPEEILEQLSFARNASHWDEITYQKPARFSVDHAGYAARGIHRPHPEEPLIPLMPCIRL